MSIGFDRPLYILPFDHRGSFQTKMFGWKGTLTAEQTAEIAAAKQVIYDGFKAAVAGGVGGDPKAYDLEVRPRLMVQAIQELQDGQVEPDIWKVEGLDRYQDCETIVATARRGGRDNVGCIILGRGEDATKVRDWLTTAARVPGFIGFAVGRTVFWDALVAWRARKTTRDEAVAEVARRYKDFVDTFATARALSPTRTE